MCLLWEKELTSQLSFWKQKDYFKSSFPVADNSSWIPSPTKAVCHFGPSPSRYTFFLSSSLRSDRISLRSSIETTLGDLPTKRSSWSFRRKWGHLGDFKLPYGWDWIDLIAKLCEVYSPLVTFGYSLMPSYLTDLDSPPRPSLSGKRTAIQILLSVH